MGRNRIFISKGGHYVKNRMNKVKCDAVLNRSEMNVSLSKSLRIHNLSLSVFCCNKNMIQRSRNSTCHPSCYINHALIVTEDQHPTIWNWRWSSLISHKSELSQKFREMVLANVDTVLQLINNKISLPLDSKCYTIIWHYRFTSNKNSFIASWRQSIR